MVVENFGRNVRFEPLEFLVPESPDQLIDHLNEHRPKNVRVIASGHAWSPLIETDSTLVKLERLNSVGVFERRGELFVRVGAGCQIKRLIIILNQQNLTLPSLGLITEQTIAGAISTGTHGSGKNSLSHYVHELSIVCDPQRSDSYQLRTVSEGSDLEAARCSLGCMGIIVEVVLPCIPQYLVDEHWSAHDTLEEALNREVDSPLQQFFLIPHKWSYYCQERRVSKRIKRSLFASCYHIYWLLCFDLGIHLGILISARWMKSRLLVRILYRHLIPLFVPRWGVSIDRSDRILTMEHELFRHLELELFVPREHLRDATLWVTKILKLADGQEVELTDTERNQLRSINLEDELSELQGSYTHHYPICFRRILADETMISMTCGISANDSPEWYSISLITYVEPRDQFLKLVTFLAKSLVTSHGARIHWGNGSH